MTLRSCAFTPVFLFGLLLATAGCESHQPLKTLEFRGQAMGTSWRVVVPGSPTSFDPECLQQEIIAELEQVEGQMSHWRDDSLVSQFNQSRSIRPMKVTAELAEVVNEAKRTFELTDGAFDISAAPLVNLWGFGPTGRAETQPDADQISAAMRFVGSASLSVFETPDGSLALKKEIPELQIDLSSLAKGYAIDRIAEHFNSRLLKNYLIEVGGELRARGANDNGTAWQIGLEQPDRHSMGRVRNTIALRDQAIATSGSYRNFIEDPKRGSRPFSHLIDPRTGRPVAHELISVSVVDSTAMRADAWATALMVLGPDAGFDLASKQEIAATFVVRSPAGISERSTVYFESHIAKPGTQERTAK